MKKILPFAGVAVISFVLGALAVYVVMTRVTPPAPAALELPADEGLVTAAGTLVMNQEGLKPDTWFVVFENDGESLAVELSFDSMSRCIGKTAAGVCSPDRFIADRAVEAKGLVNGETLLVRELRFPVPLSE